jgi:CheY-like chemotaxis protein
MAGVITGVARVLIVDDKADIRSVVATRLRIEPSFTVVGEASNGADAIARVRDLQPDLMILDLQMPVMSGEEAIPILRSLAPRLRIVVFSAYVGKPHRRVCELPDSEVRKGGGLAPLVKELHRLMESPPSDLVTVDLGPLEVAAALRASHEWARLNPVVREAAVNADLEPDFLALVGVFLALGEPLQLTPDSGWPEASICFATRLGAGRAARRALAAINGQEAQALEPLRSRLLHALPD